MSLTRRIAFGAAASWFSRGVSILLGLLLMPVLFRNLPKEELGVWLLLGQSWAALGIFDLGFGVTLTRRIAFAKGKSGSDPNSELTEESLEEIANLIASGRRVYHILALFAFVFSFGAGFFYLRSLDLKTTSLVSVWLAWGVLCATQAVGVWASIWTCVLQGVGYIGWDSILASLVSAMTLALQIIVAASGGRLVALAVVAACGALVQRFLLLGFARKRRPELFSFRGEWSWCLLKQMVPLALRAWLTSLGALLVANTDQFFIASLKGTKQLPAYRAAFLLLINLHLLAGVFSGASAVFVSHLWQAGEVQRIRAILRRNALIGLLSIGCGGAAILSLGPDLFDLWLGPGNFVGYPILGLFLLNFALEHHALVFSTCARATSDEAYSVSSIVGGVLKLALAGALTVRWGLTGLAVSSLLAQGATNHWFMVYRSGRRLGVNFLEHTRRVLLPCLVTFAICLGTMLLLCKVFPVESALKRVVWVTTVSGIMLFGASYVLVLESRSWGRFVHSLSTFGSYVRCR